MLSTPSFLSMVAGLFPKVAGEEVGHAGRYQPRRKTRHAVLHEHKRQELDVPKIVMLSIVVLASIPVHPFAPISVPLEGVLLYRVPPHRKNAFAISLVHERKWIREAVLYFQQVHHPRLL